MEDRKNPNSVPACVSLLRTKPNKGVHIHAGGRKVFFKTMKRKTLVDVAHIVIAHIINAHLVMLPTVLPI